MKSSLRPSPSMVVALIALFLSLGGVSYGLATGSIDSREIKNNTIRSRDLKNNEVRGRDLRNSTVRGADVALNTITGVDVNESKLGKVPGAERADSADIGLSPVAFARVSSSGGVREADSRGVGDGNVTAVGSGKYCFRALSFGFRSAQVTIDYADATGNPTAQVAGGNPKGDCPAGSQLEVVTGSAAGFYVWFFG
jgi:hypothetical protein